MSDIVNKPLSEVEDLFKRIVWDNLVTGVLTYFSINFWPLNSIITMITDKLFSMGRLVIDMQAIVLINETHKRAFQDAVIKLKIIGYRQGRDSAEYLKAREDAKLAFSQFVRVNA